MSFNWQMDLGATLQRFWLHFSSGNIDPLS